MAPIPIISYMDPKGSKDGMFNAWVKLLGTTYLELFIQLGAIYFAFFIFDSFLYAMAKQVYSGTAYHPLTFVVMALAVFIFAKDAPKFIKQMLGLKDNGGKFFSAFGQALGLGAVALGTASSGISNATAKYQAYEGKGKASQIAHGVFGAFSGLAGGAYKSGQSWLKSKDGSFSDVMKTNRATNQANYANGLATAVGTVNAGLHSAFGTQNEYDRMTRKINAYENAANAWDKANSLLDTDKSPIAGFGGYSYDGTTADNIKDLNDLLGRMKTSGAKVTDLKACEEAIKKAKQLKCKQIATTSMGDLTESKHKQIKQQFEIMVQTAGAYSKEEEFVNAGLGKVKSQRDLFDTPGDFNNTKKGFSDIKEAAAVDKASSRYKRATDNARANKNKNNG